MWLSVARGNCIVSRLELLFAAWLAEATDSKYNCWAHQSRPYQNSLCWWSGLTQRCHPVSRGKRHTGSTLAAHWVFESISLVLLGAHRHSLLLMPGKQCPLQCIGVDWYGMCVCVIDNVQSKAGFGAELEECLVLKVISSQQIRAWHEFWRMSDFSLKKSSTQSLSSNLAKTKLSIDWAIGEQLPWGCLSQLRLNGLVFLRAADSPASPRPIWRAYMCAFGSSKGHSKDCAELRPSDGSPVAQVICSHMAQTFFQPSRLNGIRHNEPYPLFRPMQLPLHLALSNTANLLPYMSYNACSENHLDIFGSSAAGGGAFLASNALPDSGESGLPEILLLASGHPPTLRGGKLRPFFCDLWFNAQLMLMYSNDPLLWNYTMD